MKALQTAIVAGQRVALCRPGCPWQKHLDLQTHLSSLIHKQCCRVDTRRYEARRRLQELELGHVKYAIEKLQVRLRSTKATKEFKVWYFSSAPTIGWVPAPPRGWPRKQIDEKPSLCVRDLGRNDGTPSAAAKRCRQQPLDPMTTWAGTSSAMFESAKSMTFQKAINIFASLMFSATLTDNRGRLIDWLSTTSRHSCPQWSVTTAEDINETDMLEFHDQDSSSLPLQERWRDRWRLAATNI